MAWMWLAATRPWNAVAHELLLAWIAYCLSGIVACRNTAGWLLCVVAAPGHGVVFERSYFCWRREALLESRAPWKSETLSRSTPQHSSSRYMENMELVYPELSGDGPGRHGISVSGKIFTSA